jgi:hypothetical protein
MLRFTLPALALCGSLSISAHADVLIVTTSADTGPGSLREALAQAADGDSIAFAIPAQSLAPIRPQSALPPLAGGVSIDGSTQPGASCATWPPTLLVEIDGGLLPPATPVLSVSGAAASLRGLVVRSGPGHGIRLLDATDTVIECNFVGTDVTGTQARPNSGDGVSLGHAIGTAIGGPAPTQANVVSGNGQSAIRIDGESSGTVVLGNYLGTDPTDTALLGNFGAGVNVFQGRSNTIGNPLAPNRMRANGAGAVVVAGDLAAGNAIRGNVAAGNGAHGIDLVGALLEDPNDALDADEGPNRLQNWPVLESVRYAAGTAELVVRFSVPTDPANATYPLAVDFYVADADDEEGETYLGSAEYSASDFATGFVTSSFLASGSVVVGDSVVATATDGAGNTSEFSSDFAVVPEAGGVAAGAAAFGGLLAVASRRRR